MPDDRFTLVKMNITRSRIYAGAETPPLKVIP